MANHVGAASWRQCCLRAWASSCVLLCACAPAMHSPAFASREQAPVQGLAQGQLAWPEPSWWKQYADPQLDQLMREAVRESPDLQVAEARYRAALRAVDTQRAQLQPQVRGLLDADHGYSDVGIQGEALGQRLQLNPGSQYSNSGLAGALFSWDLDLWGKQKAAIAAALGQANAARADRAMAANSLQYNVARTYFDWQSVQARLQVAHEQEQAAARYRELIVARVHAGLDDPQLLDQADASLAQQRRNVAMMEGSSELDRAELASIVGLAEGALATLQPRDLPAPELAIPPDAGIELLARRPDIVASRWQIESSVRSIDQARAAYYPDVSLMALGAYLRAYPDLGSGSRTTLTLGSIGPSISLPIFSGGRLKAQLEASQAQLDIAIANYNRTVVQAAQDTARQVHTLQQLANARTQQERELADSRSQLRRVEERRARGLDDDRAYLNAQMQLDQQRDAQWQLRNQLLATHLALIHALGGGYRADDLPALPVAARDDAR